MITKEQIIDIARDELTPIGWHEEHAKYIDGLDAFAERLVKLCKTDVSSSLSISEIKKRLDNCIDLYTDLFCQKQEVYADGWIGERKGGINCFADAFLSFDDIRTDLELDAPKGLIFDWYWDNVKNQGKEINYYSYIKGLRISDIKQI